MRKKLRHDQQVIAVLASMGLLKFDNTPVRFDAGEGLFLLQELQAIEQGLIETPFGQLKADQLIPYQFDVPQGAQEWGYDRVTPSGVAQWIAADAKDFPTVNVDRRRVTYPFAWDGLSYKYTLKDLRAAIFSNMPLEATLARAVRNGIDQHRNRVLLQGDAAVGFTGFINDPAVTRVDVATGRWDGSGATPDQIMREILLSTFTMGTLTRENYWPDTLAVPPMVYAYLTSTARSATSDTTIWGFMQNNFQHPLNLVMLAELGPTTDTGGTGPASSNRGRAILYKKSPDVVVAKIQNLFEQHAPEKTALSFEVPCTSSFSGTQWRIPIAGTYIDGVR